MSQPAHKLRDGALQVTIWRNIGDKSSWYSVIPSRGYKKGDAWKETESLRFRRPARHVQAAQPSAPAGSWRREVRREDPQSIHSGVKNPFRPQPEPGAGGRTPCPPASFHLITSTITSKEFVMTYIQCTPEQPQLIAVSKLGEITSQCPPDPSQDGHGGTEGVATRARPDAEPCRHRQWRRRCIA